MGASKWHTARGGYHLEVAEHIHKSTDYSDWALVALYYSALHHVDSVLANDPALPKDERHPRKHSGIDPGARGRNQLVRAQLPPVIHKAYRQLEELPRRTRYDVAKLQGASSAYERALPWLREIEKYAQLMGLTRPEIPTDAP